MPAVVMHPKSLPLGTVQGCQSGRKLGAKSGFRREIAAHLGKIGGRKSQYCSGRVVGTVTGLGALRRARAGGCNALKMTAVGRRSGLPEWPEDRHMIDAHLGKL